MVLDPRCSVCRGTGMFLASMLREWCPRCNPRLARAAGACRCEPIRITAAETVAANRAAIAEMIKAQGEADDRHVRDAQSRQRAIALCEANILSALSASIWQGG